MSKDPHVSREKLVEPAVGKSLGIILSFDGIPMFLIQSVVMVAQFVHEDMEQPPPQSYNNPAMRPKNRHNRCRNDSLKPGQITADADD